MAGELSGRTAIVTGGSRGIGLAIAARLAAAGAGIVIVARDPARLDAAAATLPGPITTVAGDVTDADVADAAVGAALKLGGGLDILVNNAGGPPADGALVRMPLADFDWTIAANLRSPLLWVRSAWRGAMRDRGGVVLNIASIGGMATPRGMGAYATAKAGLLHMTRMLAAELAPRIRVNALAPGLVRTDATAAVDYEAYARSLPLGRVGDGDDIAGAALFLVGDDARWITGQVLAVEGGSAVQAGRLPRGWEGGNGA